MADRKEITVAAVIPAGGAGLRMGADRPKQFLPLAGAPLLARTVAVFAAMEEISEVVVALPAAHLDEGRRLLAGIPRLRLVTGGVTRQESVARGLAALDDRVDVVLVHDGARPLVSAELVRACIEAAARDGAAVAAVPVADTLKRVEDGRIVATVERDGLWRAQTPQAARLSLLRRAMAAADEEGFTGTDECSLLERAGVPVTVVPGAESNLKVTRPEDMMIAEAMLGRAEPPRIGHGYDAHRFAAGRELVLGGVRIDWDLGLDGHSDADVLCHAVCDAILGALAAGDIGSHFPDSDPAYRGISSLKLLEEVAAMAGKRGCVVAGLDATVIAQAPKLAPHISAMRENLARSAGISPDRVSVKATTTEKMGFCGRGEGIAAHAVVMLDRLVKGPLLRPFYEPEGKSQK